MGVIETLLSQYSIESIILLLIMIVVAFKFLSELWDWGYGRIKQHFKLQSKKEQQDAENQEDILNLEEHFKILSEMFNNKYNSFEQQITDLSEQQSRIVDRLQENTRSFIIDKHHYFCYQIKAIDDMNLQSLERRYMYYKTDGGDSFIDQLMEELRQLPRVNLQHRIEEIQREGGI